MKNTRMPVAPEGHARAGIQVELSPKALQNWNPGLRAAADDAEAEHTISVLDVIGYDPWTGDGVTAKRVAAALRNIGAEKPVTVLVNSPGGDLFEGLAIYNLLRDHKGKVTTKVIGIAASAASVIAMAGDEILIPRSGFVMIHNAWVIAWGNRHDLRAAAEWLEPFDRAMSDIYAARTGLDRDDIAELMDAETWLGGSDAVEQGFADALLDAEDVQDGGDGAAALTARRKVEAALRRAGVPRSEARRLMQEIKADTPSAVGSGKPGAAGNGKPRAADDDGPATGELLNITQSLRSAFK